MENMKRDETKAAIFDLLDKNYADKVATIGEEPVKELVRMMMRDKIDELWRDHLYAMDYLKEGIGLQGYGQKDPLLEYKKQAYEMFVELIGGINAEACRWGFHLRAATQEEQAAMEAQMAAQAAAQGQFPAVANQFTHAAQTDETRPEGQQAKKAPDTVATPAATNGNPPAPPPPPV
jgi:preprotein translocase subunit SecA